MNKEDKPYCSLLAFVFATALVVYFYLPILYPLIDDNLAFSYGDFKSIPGQDSAKIRIDSIYYTFSDGHQAKESNRAFLIESPSFLSNAFGFTDTWTQSFLILFCLLLGSFGIYGLVSYFLKKEDHPIALLLLIPFYFLNMWSIDRIIHIWIWFTYALFPLFVSVGLLYLSERKYFFLTAYSILFAFFGMIPHSLFYMLLVHLYLVLFSFVSYRNLKNTLLFAFFPLILYVLLNLPPLSLFFTTEITYPMPVSLSTFGFLSLHGQLIDVLTFSNNWWPQVDAEKIYENNIFRFSSFAISAGTFLVFLLGYKKTGTRKKTIALLALLFILGFIFLAQGTNNEIFNAFLKMLDDNQIKLLALLREPGRIVLMIPVFIMLTMLASVNGLKQKERHLFFAAMLFIIFIHILSSPILEYMGTSYSATEVPGDYAVLRELPKEYKALRVEPTEAPKVLGSYRYAWNPDKSYGWLMPGISSIYPRNCSAALKMANGTASEELFKALNVKYMILMSDVWEASGFDANYSWMECNKLEYLTLCENKEETEPFSIYVINQNLSLGSADNTSKGPASVRDFKRVNPTLWYVNVSAEGPFLLSFAETYDPSWEAKLSSNETFKPVLLFETINGYRINRTGELEIELRYAPQGVFDFAAIISAATLVICVLYMIYSILKQRNDAL